MEGVEVSLHALLTSELDGGEWPASRPGRFTRGDRAPDNHWIVSWVGPKCIFINVVSLIVPDTLIDLLLNPYIRLFSFWFFPPTRILFTGPYCEL